MQLTCDKDVQQLDTRKVEIYPVVTIPLYTNSAVEYGEKSKCIPRIDGSKYRWIDVAVSTPGTKF